MRTLIMALALVLGAFAYAQETAFCVVLAPAEASIAALPAGICEVVQNLDPSSARADWSCLFGAEKKRRTLTTNAQMLVSDSSETTVHLSYSLIPRSDLGRFLIKHLGMEQVTEGPVLDLVLLPERVTVETDELLFAAEDDQYYLFSVQELGYGSCRPREAF